MAECIIGLLSDFIVQKNILLKENKYSNRFTHNRKIIANKQCHYVYRNYKS